MTVSRPRCVVVALVLTAGCLGAAVGLGAAVLGGSGQGVEDAVVRLCLALLLGCTLWAWATGVAAVADAWRGALARRPGGGVRRLVLAACGVAVTGALLAPAAHADGGHPDPMVGLPLPQRPVDGPAPHAGPAVVVRTGDTLWSLAAARLPPGAGAPAVDAAWRRLYAANRAVVGPDPDLIHPGQQLDPPPPPTKESS